MGSGKRNVPFALLALFLGAAVLYTLQLTSPPRHVYKPPADAGQATPFPVDELEDPQPDEKPTADRDALVQLVDQSAALAYQDEGLLRGIVVDPDSNPIAGALVEVESRDTQGFSFLDLDYSKEVREIASTPTDQEGRFAFDLPRFHAFQLHVEAEGYAPSTVPDCRAGEERVIAMQLGAVLEGHVTRKEDRSPVEGARMELVNRPGFQVETTTDGLGYYRFENVLPGQLNLSVYPLRDVHIFSQVLDLDPGQTRLFDLQVERGSMLRGTVVDAITGQPIRDAEVGMGWTFDKSARTDASGQYLLHGFTGKGIVQVTARAAGYGRTEQRIPGEIGPETVMNFQLIPSGSVSGRVLNAEGDPEAGVYVAAMAYYQPGPVGGKQDWRSARTGDDGRYLIVDLRTDLTHALLVRDPGHGMLVYDFPRNPVVGETLDLGDVVLHPGSTIEGRVVDTEGRGVTGARIELRGHNEDRFAYFPGGTPPPEHVSPEGHYLRERETTTGPQGGFSITDLSPAEYELNVIFERKRLPSQTVVIQDWGQVVRGLEIAVQSGLSIQGSVFTPDGEVIEEAIISAYGEDGGPGGSNWFRSGAFEIKGLEPGTYTVGVMLIRDAAENWVSGRTSGVEAGSTGVRVVLRRPEWIEGVVLDADGNPVAGMSVLGVVQEALRPRERGSVRTGMDGRFRLKVGVGEILDIRAGPPTELVDAPPGMVLPPDRDKRVTVEEVIAGTKDLMIRLK